MLYLQVSKIIMDLYGTNSKSIQQKITVHVIEIFLLWLSFWILFQKGCDWFANLFSVHNGNAFPARRVIIFIFNIITFLRLGYMMFFLLKRKIPWEESISVPFAFSLYYIGFSLFVLPTTKPVDGVDISAILLFVAGCVLNSRGEILRTRWKKNPANKGKIYTEGFFHYARHINYFGDILWVSAYAVLTRNYYALTIPVFLFCFFAFYNAPKLDKYLREKYRAQYSEYARKTKMLIPFIY